MSHRCLAAVFAVVSLTQMFADAQSTNTAEPPRTRGRGVRRTCRACGTSALSRPWNARRSSPEKQC